MMMKITVKLELPSLTLTITDFIYQIVVIIIHLEYIIHSQKRDYIKKKEMEEESININSTAKEKIEKKESEQKENKNSNRSEEHTSELQSP